MQRDPVAGLLDTVRKLMQKDAGAAIYKETAEKLTVTLPHLASSPVWAQADPAAIYKRLIVQPADGMHQLAYQVCHLATSGVPDVAQRLMAELGVELNRLVAALESLTPQEQNRVVLFVVATRAFSKDILLAETVTKLHRKYFTRFDPVDLALPYSVMFYPQFFSANRSDLIDIYLPRGYLEVINDLRPQHMLLLAWLAGQNIFSGPLALAEVVVQADMSNAVEAAALRSLVMRFGGPALNAQLGLPGSAVVAADSADRAQAARLGRKPYQALNASFNRVRLALPFMAPLQRKPKVGICLSGQLRGYEAALATWHSCLFPFIEPHIFVHSWYDVGRSGAQPSRAVLPFAGAAFTRAYKDIGVALGFETMKEHYPTLFRKLTEGARVSEEAIAAAYEADHVVLEDDTSEAFSSFTNQQKMHYKIQAADTLARQGGDYDLLMRLRPDLSLRDIAFAWPDLQKVAQSGPIIFAEKGFGVHYGSPMIGDQCAIATPQTMQIYADTWSSYPELVRLGLAKVPDQFKGHISLAQTCWLNGVDVIKAPIWFGQLNEAHKLSAADTLAALEADSRNSQDDLTLLKAARMDL